MFLIPYVAMVVGLYWLKSAWISFLIYHGLILVVIASDRPLFVEFSRGWSLKWGVAAALFGCGGGGLMWWLAPHAGIDATVLNPALAELGLTGRSWLAFAFYHALVNPWFEEVFWRGKLGSSARGPVLGDVLFAGYHALVLALFLSWIWIVLAMLVLTGAGWFWRLMRRSHGGLGLPVLSHLVADGGIMIAVHQLAREAGR